MSCGFEAQAGVRACYNDCLAGELFFGFGEGDEELGVEEVEDPG